MKTRLETSVAGRVVDEGDKGEFEDLLDQVGLLDCAKWPSAVKVPWYQGEKKLVKLANRFDLCWNEVRGDFREYLRSRGNSVPKPMQKLRQIVNTIPVTSADCERGFSSMNNLITPSRNRLTLVHASNLMFVKLVGPPLDKFHPMKYVKPWLRENHRSATDTRTRLAQTQHSQRYSVICDLM